jgi:hypothetical protein
MGTRFVPQLCATLLYMAGAVGQTAPVISVSPAAPTDQSVLHITVATDAPCYPSGPGDGVTTTVVEQTIQIVARLTCIALTPPPPYVFSVDVGPLLPGQYRIQYLASSGAAPPGLLASALVQVSGAIPTLTLPGFVALIALVLVVAVFTQRSSGRRGA